MHRTYSALRGLRLQRAFRRLRQPVTTWTYEAIVNGYGGSMMDPSNTEITFNSEKAIKAMELYRQGISEGWANIKVGGTATADARLEFQNQRSGFIVESTGSLKMLMGYAELQQILAEAVVRGWIQVAGSCAYNHAQSS